MSLRQIYAFAPDANIEPPKSGRREVPETGDPETNIVVKPKTVTEKPPLYKVFLLNDDYTPMDFVVAVLETIFHKNHEEATRIMLHVHRRGLGLCGVFSYEIAETKVALVLDAARAAGHPLQCKMEKE